jgi:PAS domain S-box-containing protein
MSATETAPACTCEFHKTAIDIATMYGELTSDAVVAITRDGVIRYLNRNAEAMFGRAAVDVVGRQADELVPGRYRGTRLSTLASAVLNRTHRGHQGSHVMGLRADGEEFPVDLSLSQVDSHDEVLLIAGIRDVSEREAAAAALRESTERLESVFHGTPIALWDEDTRAVAHRLEQLRAAGVADLEAHLDSDPDVLADLADRLEILDANRAAFELFEVDDIDQLRRLVRRMITTPEGTKPFTMVLQAIWNNRDSARHAFSAHRGDGTPLELMLHWQAQRVDDRLSLAHATTSIVDVTALHLAQRELEATREHLERGRKLEAIGQLAAGVAHEINTPLQYVAGNATFLQQTFDELAAVWRLAAEVPAIEAGGGDVGGAIRTVSDAATAADVDYLLDETPQAFQDLRDGVERVTTIVQALKEFSHPGSGRKQNEDINAIVETSVAVSRNEWKHSAVVTLDLATGLPQVPCLRSEVSQVLVNLLVNAAHAIESAEREEGKITIGTGATTSEVFMTVADNGIGMSEDNIRRAFEPFFTTKEVGKGTGQGLPLAHKVIVDQHGGRIEVDSEPGIGSLFTLTLPVAAPGNLPPA